MHNALQDGEINLSDLKKSSYQQVIAENAARETVHRKFLICRLLEQFLDLFGSFETNFRLRMS